MAAASIAKCIWTIFFSWMPIGLQLAFGAIVAVAIVVMIIKVIGFILDAIPFL